MIVIGSSLDESVTVPCRVAGDPSIITFEWTFANSGERFDVTATGGISSSGSGGSSSSNNNNAIGDELGIGESITTKQQNGVLDYSDNNSNGMLKFALSCSNGPNKLPASLFVRCI